MHLLKKQSSGLARISSVLSTEGLDHIFETEDSQVKWDFNLSRLPYFTAGKTRADRFRSLELKEEFQKDGKVIQTEWLVIHNPKLGLPGSFDRDVWIGILQIIAEITDGGRQPVPERIELGTAYSFLQKIGKPINGKYRGMLKDSIERLATTGCVTKGSFNCPSSGGYLHLGEVFHLIRSWGFKGDPQTGGGVHETNFVILDQLIKKNLDSFYVSILRVDFMRNLKGEITKLLYPLLAYRFWRARQRKHSGWRVHYSELVSYIALKGIDSLKRAKDTLKPALKELMRKEYISDESFWEGDYYTFYPGLDYVREHQQKVLTKDNYRAKKQKNTHQIGSFPAVKPVWHGTQNYPDTKEGEISYQLCKLRAGRPLNFERLKKLNIDPQEVYEALEKSTK